ncbi:hypothetical protein [Geobacter sp.]|uniref:hypothetical protein n=1 Tax=Geobacter sp. TaxID=46610 RepID=UPI0027B92028|nr:hypothetical protein [Geobacter sp.]
MKKFIAVIAVMIALEGMAFAAGKIPTTTMGGKAFTFKSSSNVDVTYYTTNAATNTAGTVNTDYVANTKNTSGNRLFSSSNNTSNLWYQEDNDWKGKDVAGTTKAIADFSKGKDSDYDAAGGWSSQ